MHSPHGCGNTQTSGDVMVPAGYKPALKKVARIRSWIKPALGLVYGLCPSNQRSKLSKSSLGTVLKIILLFTRAKKKKKEGAL